jgi:leader peptidase (prepilin peptidase)/N-methyltransferase
MPAIFIAYLVGALVGLSLLVIGRKDRKSQLPLGVFLAPGGWLIFLYGQQLWQAYLNWLGY